MLDESTCHFRGVGSIFLSYSILEANNVDSGQTPNYVASELCLHCLLMSFQVGIGYSMVGCASIHLGTLV